MYDFLILGANGIQGRIISRDLLEQGFKILFSDKNNFGFKEAIKAKNKKIEFKKNDLDDFSKTKIFLKKNKSKIVINCAIDDYSLMVSKICLDLSLNYLDLGSTEEMTQNQLKLHKDYKKKKLIGITGMGSTPGINNVMLRYLKPKFDVIRTVHLGFVFKSNLPIFVPQFSLDCIAWEFTELVKILENGKFVYKKPSDCKINYNYKGIGRQKTFYTRHAEYVSFYNYLKEMGLKNLAVFSSFPEYSYKIFKDLINLGFTSKKGIKVNGFFVRPLDVSVEVLRKIQVPKKYKEKENIWLKVFGFKNGKKIKIEMDAITETLPGWEEATSNIDTGFPVSITAKMIKFKQIKEYGYFAPEFCVPPDIFFKELGKKGIKIYENGRRLN
jgi:lysine 6-dehydrogenase